MPEPPPGGWGVNPLWFLRGGPCLTPNNSDSPPPPPSYTLHVDIRVGGVRVEPPLPRSRRGLPSASSGAGAPPPAPRPEGALAGGGDARAGGGEARPLSPRHFRRAARRGLLDGRPWRIHGYVVRPVDRSDSVRRLADALSALQVAVEDGVVEAPDPSHLLTLTVPPEVWEDLLAQGREEEAVRVWKVSLDRFLDALGQRLRRAGILPSWLWFVESQWKRRPGAPHIHILLDLGGYLPEEDWRDWAQWVEDEWAWALSAAAGFPVRARTRLEALRRHGEGALGGAAYAVAYATGGGGKGRGKGGQKVAAFPAMGRMWGVAGAWRLAFREARRYAASRVVRIALRAEAAMLWLHRLRARLGRFPSPSLERLWRALWVHAGGGPAPPPLHARALGRAVREAALEAMDALAVLPSSWAMAPP